MNQKGMTLGVEIFVIIFFAFAAFLSVYILTKSFMGKYIVNENKPSYYHKIELELENIAKKYIEKNETGEKIIISSNTLREVGYYTNKCDGYVIVDKTTYKPFIKCDDYITNGYSKELAN